MAVLGPELHPHASVLLAHLAHVDSRVDRKVQEGIFGGRTLEAIGLAFTQDLGLVAQHAELREPRERHEIDAGERLVGRELPLDAKRGHAGVDRDDAHLVQGDRAGLVEAHHLRRAERLDGLELPNHGSLAQHVSHPERERRDRHRR